MNEENNSPKRFSVANVRRALRASQANKRMRNLLALTAGFVLIAILLLVLYLVVWRYRIATDDAYVKGHVVYINSQVTGMVNKVAVEDTDRVKAGDLLVLLDKADYQMAYDRALNQLRLKVSSFKNSTNHVAEAESTVALKKAAYERAKQDYERRVALLKSGAISAEELNHLKIVLTQAEEEATIARQQYLSSLNDVQQGLAIAEQPAIKVAIADLKEAWLNLQRTEIRAPISGEIAKRNIQIGQKVAAGQNLLSIIALDDLWVEANFKESQLKHIRVGQPVRMTADVFGGSVVYHGKVVGLSAGTGSAFALLPAQNATGNWIKVVQRVPVRISLDKGELARHPLRVGLSMDTTVYVGGKHKKALTHRDSYGNSQKELVTVDFSPIEEVIAQILQE